jgi:iron complex transport system substrate-binding protein
VFPVTVTDTNGSEVTFEEAPSSIVALAPSFVEVFCALGACESLVAIDENSDYPPEVADIPKLSGFSPSVEGIAASEPQLVVISFDPGGLQDSLEMLGITVLFLDAPATVEGVYEQIELLGAVIGNPDGAAELVAGMQADVEEITALVPDGEGPRVFHELDATLYTAGPGSFIADLYEVLGAQNIAAGADSPFAQMTAEAIIAADPEVIILADEGLGESPETVAARPGWGAVSAVVNGRVHGADPNILSRPGPRIVEALEQLAAFLYPEVFS